MITPQVRGWDNIAFGILNCNYYAFENPKSNTFTFDFMPNLNNYLYYHYRTAIIFLRF